MAKKTTFSENLVMENLEKMGRDYQFKLVKLLIEDSQYFLKIQSKIDPNMFTEDALRRIVGFAIDRYNSCGVSPDYVDLDLYIRTKVSDTITLAIILETLNEIRGMDLKGQDLIKENAQSFFMQQNLKKAINKSIEIMKNGDHSRYYEIEDNIKKALEVNGSDEIGYNPMDNIEEALKEDYRRAIPTGFIALDRSLNGGLASGELGVVIAPSGVGKAQPLNSRIVTPNGYKTMGDMVVGDYVIGQDGKKHKVIGVYPQEGLRPVYRVDFSNGTSCECDIEHLWNVCGTDGKEFKTKTLREIINYTSESYYIHRVKPVEFERREIEYKTTYIDNQNIAEDYLFNDISTRLRIVNDLVKQSGRIKEDGNLVIYFSLETYSEQICWLIHSLGGSCEVVENRVEFILPEEQHKMVLDDLGYNYPIPLLDPTLKILTITYVGEQKTQCIMVDSEEHLYLTEEFIVTHNTSVTTGFAASAATYECRDNDYRGFKVLHIHFEDTDTNIKRKYYGWLTGVDAVDLSRPDIKPMVMEKLKTQLAKETQMLRDNVWCVRPPSGEVSASGIEELIKQGIARGFKPDLVIIDYFECLAHEKGDRTDSEWTSEGKTMRKLESIGHKYDCAIWCPIQGTKDTFDKEIIGLSGAGGSVKKVQIGHVIITLARTQEQKKNHRLTISIEKFRAGRMDDPVISNVKFNNGTCRFELTNDDVDEMNRIKNLEDIAFQRERNNAVKNVVSSRN